MCHNSVHVHKAQNPRFYSYAYFFYCYYLCGLHRQEDKMILENYGVNITLKRIRM